MPQFATVLGLDEKGGLMVDVADIDPALLGKAPQHGKFTVLDTAGAKDMVALVQAAFPAAQVFASMEDRRPTIEQMLIDAGLRVRQPDGGLALSPAVIATEAGMAIH